MTFTNGLSDAQVERLALLAEECAEVIQVVGKALRHGYESTHPDGGDANRALLEKELGDVFAACDLMVLARDVSFAKVQRRSEEKHVKVQRFLHHQPERLMVQLADLKL